ncbi:MAG: hypothetical protein QG608_1732 [Actinomycetota bacterium]|nr:hypothetical protein [Actinomycetota bacterium]
MSRLLVGTGASTTADALSAGREAAAEAVAQLNGCPVALVIVHVSVRYDPDVLLAGVRDVTGQARLVGSSSSGQIHQDTLVPPGQGVAVLVLGGQRHRFGVGSCTGLSESPWEAGRLLAHRALDDLHAPRREHAAVLLFSGGPGSDQQSLLNGVHRVAGAAVPVVGGVAGDDQHLKESFVLHGDRVLRDAAVAVWIDSPVIPQVAHGHGWEPTGLPLQVTHVEGTLVRELGGRPAMEVFRERLLDKNGGPRIQDCCELRYRSTHAFGLIEPDGKIRIRGACVDEHGDLRTFVPLPQYGAVQIVTCSPDSLLAVAQDVAERALAVPDPSVLLVFSCVTRLNILADREREEAKHLQAVARGVPVFGFYTYGEFARTASVSGYHNATIVALAL